MAREVRNPPELFDSLRSGFSQIALARGATHIHISGQVAWDRDRRVVGRTLAEQAPVAFANLKTALEAADAAPRDVLSLRIYIAEEARADLSPIREALRSTFPTDPPATTWIVVRALADPAFLVEVEAQAVR